MFIEFVTKTLSWHAQTSQLVCLILWESESNVKKYCCLKFFDWDGPICPTPLVLSKIAIVFIIVSACNQNIIMIPYIIKIKNNQTNDVNDF